MNKGPGRPIFPEAMRAEMLAALEYVDWVAVDHTSDARSRCSRAVKPDVYVKGSDYENPEDDISGKIGVERNVVEEQQRPHRLHQGHHLQLVGADQPLPQRLRPAAARPARPFAQRGRAARHARADRAGARLPGRAGGDTIIDEYQYVRPMGKAAKENIIASLSTGSEIFAGGVIAAANHVASFCREVEVVTRSARSIRTRSWSARA